MPIRLEPLDVIDELKNFASVLIVSCPVCPAVSLALQENKPLFEFFKHGIKTEAFEVYVSSIRRRLETSNVKTEAFTMRVPHPLMCLWTEGQRNRLSKRATSFEAALVLGCYSAAQTAFEALKGTNCEVIHGMQELGLTNATLRYKAPLTVTLEAHPVSHKPWATRDATLAGTAQHVQEGTR